MAVHTTLHTSMPLDCLPFACAATSADGHDERDVHLLRWPLAVKQIVLPCRLPTRICLQSVPVMRSAWHVVLASVAILRLLPQLPGLAPGSVPLCLQHVLWSLPVVLHSRTAPDYTVPRINLDMLEHARS